MSGCDMPGHFSRENVQEKNCSAMKVSGEMTGRVNCSVEDFVFGKKVHGKNVHGKIVRGWKKGPRK